MKYIFVLFLLFNTCLAQQTIIITDEHRVPITGASVFLMGDKNTLVSVSDENGNAIINLTDNGKYLIHSLGYVDAIFDANELNKSPSIKLKTINYQLKDVVVKGGLRLYTQLHPTFPKPYDRSLSDHPQDASIQRVIILKIDTPGYLKSFKLFCKVQVKEVVPDYRFILLNAKDNKPDSLLLPLKIDVKVSKTEINFDLLKTNYYLEKGIYYIGYETFNGKAIIKKQLIYTKQQKELIKIPIVIFCSADENIHYQKNNLSAWWIPKTGNLVNGKMVWFDDLKRNFAYELQLLH